MLDKQGIYHYLHERGISFTVTEHPAVYNMDEISKVDLPYPEADAKNLFIRDDKKKHYYLLSVKGDKRVDLKAFRRSQGLRPLSFASAAELKEKLGLIPGAVTPLGLLNDEGRSVTFYLDKTFLGGLIGVHPNDNTATIWLKTEDLLKVIKAWGNAVQVVDFI